MPALVDLSVSPLSRSLRKALLAAGRLACSAPSFVRKQLFRTCLLRTQAASCSPALLPRFAEALLLSVAQNLGCADWLRLWRESCGQKGSTLRISSSTV